MSGHSKWATTHRQKEATDAKRGALFTKITNLITLAVREGGPDPETNFKLRLAIDKARMVNMPKENIERAIRRGSSSPAGELLEEVTYEALGPAKTAFILELTTNNRNRTRMEIKKILEKVGGRWATPNSLLWQFSKKGVLRISSSTVPGKNEDDKQLFLIDLGLEDIQREEGDLVLYTASDDLGRIKKVLEEKGVLVKETTLEYVPNTLVYIKEVADKENIEKLFTLLEKHPEITNFYTNAES